MTKAAWALVWRGHVYRSDDLTGEHAVVVAELFNIDPGWEWFDLSELNPAHGPLQTMALIAAFVIVSEQVTGDDARRTVLDNLQGVTLDDLVGAIVLPLKE